MEKLIENLKESFKQSVLNFYSYFQSATEILNTCEDNSGDEVATLKDKHTVSIHRCTKELLSDNLLFCYKYFWKNY